MHVVEHYLLCVPNRELIRDVRRQDRLSQFEFEHRASVTGEWIFVCRVQKNHVIEQRQQPCELRGVALRLISEERNSQRPPRFLESGNRVPAQPFGERRRIFGRRCVFLCPKRRGDFVETGQSPLGDLIPLGGLFSCIAPVGLRIPSGDLQVRLQLFLCRQVRFIN